ncbi:MAG: M56 family metallopeptidase [Coriobacteriia bacterium]|nr:M56 family metallopeptidase [Coriobacteriia bacterium]
MPAILKAYFLQLLTVSLISSVLIALIILITALLGKRYSPRWRYLAFLLISIWLIVPVTVSLPKAPVQITLPETLVIQAAEADTKGNDGLVAGDTDKQQQNDDVADVPLADIPTEDGIPNNSPSPSDTLPNDPVSPDVLTATPTAHAFPVMSLAVGAWLVGLIATLVVRLALARLFRARLQSKWRSCDRADIASCVRQTMEDMGYHKEMDLKLSSVAQSPFITGLVRPVFVLPDQQYDPDLLAHIVRHELTHSQRRDLWYKFVINLATSLHWFNPLVWMMNQISNRDLELICDELVISGQTIDKRKQYGESILLTVRPGVDKRPAALTTSFSVGAKNLKERFESIMSVETKRKGSAVFSVLVSLALVASCTTQLNVNQPEQQQSDEVLYKNDQLRRLNNSPVATDPDLALDFGDDLALLVHSMWFYKSSSGEYHEMLFIKDVVDGVLTFDLMYKEIFTVEDCQTSGSIGHFDTGYVFEFDCTVPVWGSNDADLHGSLLYDFHQDTLTMTLEASDESIGIEHGDHVLANGQDDVSVRISVYKTIIGSFVDMYNDTTYYISDLNNDGISELIIREGDSEADFSYRFYGFSRAGLIYIDTLSAAHSYLIKSPEGSVLIVTAHMGYQVVTKLDYNGKDIGTETVLEVTSSADEPYERVPGFDLHASSILDLRMVDSMAPGLVVRDFFDYFAAGEYERMNELFYGGDPNWDYSNGVFGMSSARILVCEYYDRSDYEWAVIGAGEYAFVCNFDMTPADPAYSVYSSDQATVTLFIIVSYIDGDYRIVASNSSP